MKENIKDIMIAIYGALLWYSFMVIFIYVATGYNAANPKNIW